MDAILSTSTLSTSTKSSYYVLIFREIRQVDIFIFPYELEPSIYFSLSVLNDIANIYNGSKTLKSMRLDLNMMKAQLMGISPPPNISPPANIIAPSPIRPQL